MLSHQMAHLWHDILRPEVPWPDKIIRPILIYVFMLLLFRFASRRELAQATLFDFLIILLISNVVQNAMIGPDNSVLGAAIGAIILVLLSALLNRQTAHSRKVRFLLEGKAVLLVRSGTVNDTMMDHYSVSRNDLFCAVRKQGLIRLSDVAYAILELDGSISVIRNEDNHAPHDCLPPEIAGNESCEDTNQERCPDTF